MNSDRFYTYLFFDPVRKEPFYVGKGCFKRYLDHFKRTDHAPLPHRLQAMKANGITPIITFIVRDVDNELACLVEQEAISKYGRKDLGFGPLLNMTDGGEGVPGSTYNRGRIHSAEKRERMGCPRGHKQSAEQIAGTSALHTGAKRKPITGNRISASLKEHNKNIPTEVFRERTRKAWITRRAQNAAK